MKKFKIILLIAITTCLTFSCNKDESATEISKEGGPFEISELAGNWEATQGGFLRISDNLWVDIVADGGSLSLTVQSNGRCTFTVDPIDREAYTVSGEMFWGSYEGDDALVIVWDGSSANEGSFFPVQGVELTATTFELGCLSECGEYDFNNNGNFEVADLGFVFIRN
jgi:hypothetical protein